jgi:hypothetical protein
VCACGVLILNSNISEPPESSTPAPFSTHTLHSNYETALTKTWPRMQWNPEILRKLIAPDIDEFTSAEIPDLRELFPQATYWLANHFLNNVGRGSFQDGARQVALNFIRRAQNAFTHYHAARVHTGRYLGNNDPHNPKASAYFTAVSEWEEYALQISMPIDLFKWLNQEVGAFSKNDGSREQRLYDIANLVKHTASAVRSGQCKPEHTLPLWLTNEGLSSFGLAVTYQEAAAVLGDIARLADAMQDPTTFRERLQKA